MRADLPAAALLGDGAGPGGLPGHLHHALQVKRLQVQPTIPSARDPCPYSTLLEESRAWFECGLCFCMPCVCTNWHVCAHQDASGC